mmetsp:Transcript_25045/g.24517  ORF Transcript_25045/g.24517 Transcript_25045/m.24517 type:complete len:107 (+) Transcript_25045:778-1098(+)
MKLYDGVELGTSSDVYKYFNHVIELDFLRYHLRQDLEPQTISMLILGFNQTPEQFVSPSMETIEMVVKAVDAQMQVDKETEDNEVRLVGLSHHGHMGLKTQFSAIS